MSTSVTGTTRGSATRRGRGSARGGTQKKAGPRPARHIPWPEIFKHHISLVEGHLRMIDMVRKHTVEGSGNNRTIQTLVDRAQTMLRDAKAVQREFVPPKDAWQKVPIGSSSDTMYPGYSPKDHEYGKAAQEFGKQWSEARKNGIEFDAGPDGPDYQFGQSKASKKRRLDEHNGTDSAGVKAESSDKEIDANATAEQTTEDNSLFFFDSKPTPINGLSKTTEVSQANTDSISQSEASSRRPNDSQKAKSPAPVATEHAKPVIEYENIDREVDARLKLKADAEKNKKDKKRKRESVASTDIPLEADISEEHPPEKKTKSKKKKKSKSQPVTEEPDPADTEMEDAPLQRELDEGVKVSTEDTNENSDTSKRIKKNKSSSEDGDTDRKKKKQKKNKHKE